VNNISHKDVGLLAFTVLPVQKWFAGDVPYYVKMCHETDPPP